ncbi:MAG: pentapeptide repeat-containing protein [Symploca sp. SIO2D2]|nr:pentapeptide repeat-containing protein [Symploca sp. SIO2D2]
MLFGVYIGWRSLKVDERDAWIRDVAIVFAATEGTSFNSADLTDADFTRARLKSTDLRKAILTRTRWHNANTLDRVMPETSYLNSIQVRELVRTLQGQDKNFNKFPLSGVNLQGANLADASFIGADLNAVNLQDADLSRAKLVQTSLDEADLTGATLTGATIEDWGITRSTQLRGVRCRYVFMSLSTKDDPNPRRKPDNWEEEFEDGDFADFIKPIVDTLDLYHNQGVDPRAIAISFKQLAENNPDAELEIVAMEKRGKDKFLLRAATASNADHSQLNADYFTIYNEIKALAEGEVKTLLAEKDSRIASLETMIQTALQRPSFYAQNYHHQGDTMSDKSSDISISHVTGSKISGIAAGKSTAVGGENLTGVAGGDISGTVTNTINQLTESESPEAPTLADLLKQLQQAIASPDSGLSEKDKKKALRHLDTIGKLGVERNNSDLRSMAEDAMDALPTILKQGTGLIEFLKGHFDVELDAILDNIQRLLGMANG